MNHLKPRLFRYLRKNYGDDKMLLELTAVVEKMKQMKKRTYVMGKKHMNIVKVYPDDILYIDDYKRGSEIHVQENYKDYSFEDRITTKEAGRAVYGFEGIRFLNMPIIVIL